MADRALFLVQSLEQVGWLYFARLNSLRALTASFSARSIGTVCSHDTQASEKGFQQGNEAS